MNEFNQSAYSTITSDEDKHIIAKKFLLALQKRDWDLLRSIITEDVTWTIPGYHLLKETFKGHDAIVGKARQILNYPFCPNTDDALYSLNCIALVMLDEELATVCVLRDGKISAIMTFLSDIRKVDKLLTIPTQLST
jgi:ketosteroid isomerase-like protein